MTGPRCSANFALVASEDDGSLDVVRQRGSRLIAEHGLEHGKDALGRRRGGREGEDDPRCLCPRRRKLAAVDLPPVEHTFGEGVVVLRLGALRRDSRPRRSSRALSTRPTERRQIACSQKGALFQVSFHIGTGSLLGGGKTGDITGDFHRRAK